MGNGRLIPNTQDWDTKVENGGINVLDMLASEILIDTEREIHEVRPCRKQMLVLRKE